MSDEGGEKTEEATQKKIDDSRKNGQVWKSRDFTVPSGTPRISAISP